MCGIAGLFALDDGAEADLAPVEAMVAALDRRGPDGCGFHRDGPLAMGMARLSIVDVGGSRQPLHDHARGLTLICNGEIYNYLELRAELEGRGHRFETDGDCETLLALYAEHGLDMLARVRGMYAFALWDARARRLVIGRDRMGEKPLYLARTPQGLLFASEMKAILASGLVPFTFDPSGLEHYFQHGYLPEPRTFVRGVEKLPRAHMLVMEPGREPRRIEYWRMEDAPPLEGDPTEVIRERFDDAVRLCVGHGQRVGVLLSGGLDSSAVGAVAAKHLPPRTLETFTAGFAEDAALDERPLARRLADRLGGPHTDIALSPEGVVESWDALIYDLDDPIADPAGAAYRDLYRALADTGARIVLTGQGADELFWGYDWTRLAVREEIARRAGAASPLPRFSAPGARSPKALGVWAAEGFGYKPWARSQGRVAAAGRPFSLYDVKPESAMATRLLEDALTSEARAALDPGAPVLGPDYGEDPAVLVTRLACDTYLLENGLAQGDRLAMGASVELRSPFVEHRFVEAVIGLQRTRPDHGEPPKARLKRAVADVLPAEVLQRRKKGFEPPVRRWVQALMERYGDRLGGGFLVSEGLFRAEPFGALRRFSPVVPKAHMAPYAALVLETWCERMSAVAAEAPRPAAARPRVAAPVA